MGELVTVAYTESCSGCTELGEYGASSQYYDWDPKAKCYIGAGCHECGYTGKRRVKFKLSREQASFVRDLERELAQEQSNG